MGVFNRDIRRWSPDDDRRLAITYATGGVEASRIEFPNRSISSIIGRAKKIGLSRSGTAKLRYWTGADEMRLRKLWPDAPRYDVEVALPGRTWKSITSKARKLELFRKPHARFPQHSTSHQLLGEIRARMVKRNFTSTDLQVCAGIKRGSTSTWFSGNAEPKLQNIERAVEALGGKLVIVWDD